MYSILAGLMISMGGIIYLQIGGIIGATLFSIGLITVLMLKFELFTGKAGLLPTNDITWKKLLCIWLGNLYGCIMVATILSLTPIGASLVVSAQAIAVVRLANGPLANMVLGGCCGILMYIAVTLFNKQNNPIYAAMPVATFILSGFNHCVADMFYFSVAEAGLNVWATIIPTTLGNICGCCLIPFVKNHQETNYPTIF